MRSSEGDTIDILPGKRLRVMIQIPFSLRLRGARPVTVNVTKFDRLRRDARVGLSDGMPGSACAFATRTDISSSESVRLFPFRSCASESLYQGQRHTCPGRRLTFCCGTPRCCTLLWHA